MPARHRDATRRPRLRSATTSRSTSFAGAQHLHPDGLPHHPAFGGEVDAELLEAGVVRADATCCAGRRRSRSRSRRHARPCASRTRPATSSRRAIPRAGACGCTCAPSTPSGTSSSSPGATSSRRADACVDDPSTCTSGRRARDRRGARGRGRPPGRHELPPRAEQRPPEGQPHPAARLHQRRLRRLRRRSRSARPTPTASTGTTSTYPVGADAVGRRGDALLPDGVARVRRVPARREHDQRRRQHPLRSLGPARQVASPWRWRSGSSRTKAKSPRAARRASRSAAEALPEGALRRSGRAASRPRRDGLTCDAAARDATLADAEAEAARRASAASRTRAAPARTCTPLEPRPRDLVPGALRGDHALRHERPRRLHRSASPRRSTATRSRPPTASRRPRSRTPLPAARARLPGAPRQGGDGLAAGWTARAREVRGGERDGQERPPVDCATDPERSRRRRRRRASEIARCDDFAGLAGLRRRRATSRRRWPASRTRSRRRATGYVGVAYP